MIKLEICHAHTRYKSVSGEIKEEEHVNGENFVILSAAGIGGITPGHETPKDVMGGYYPWPWCVVFTQENMPRMYYVKGTAEEVAAKFSNVHEVPTLRDQFAMALLQGAATISHQGSDWDYIAREAFRGADALLAERMKGF